MADENTTDLTPTPTPNPAPDPNPQPDPAQGSDPTSTTDPNPQPDPTPGTILTSDPDPDPDPAPEPTDEEKAAAEAKAALFGAPEGDYEVSGLPDGVTVDTAALAAVTPVAKELGLSNEGLSKIAGVYAEQVLPGVVQQVVDGIQQDVLAQHAQWATEATELVKTDAAFEGKSLKDVKSISAKTLDRFGGEDFRSFLDETGIGNHPAMLKFAYLVGSAISEDTTFERGNNAPKPKTSVEKFYG